MKTRVSNITTIEPGQRNSVNEAYKFSQRQTSAQAAPSISMQGTPGEYDHRKFITPPLANLVPVQTGTNGGPVVGSLAISTNPLQWRDYDPGFYEGMFPVRGEKPSKPYYYTDLSTDPPTPPSFTPAPLVPTRAIVTQRTTARAFSVNITQDKGRHS